MPAQPLLLYILDVCVLVCSQIGPSAPVSVGRGLSSSRGGVSKFMAMDLSSCPLTLI